MVAFFRRKNEEPRVELTPMVDVVFLLLIFFMISTTFVETPGISVKLPESSSRKSIAEEKEVKVHLTSRGEIYLGDVKTSLPDLAPRLKELRREAGGDISFVLLADQDARHGQVVKIMDLAREAGFGTLAIATESRRKP